MGIKGKMKFFVLMFVIICLSCASVGEKKREARARYKLGVSYLNGDRLQAAYVEFQKSIELNPRDKETHNALGYVYMNLSNYDKAIKHYRKAVALDSSYSEAHNNLCFLNYKMGKWDKAIKYCEKALGNQLYKTPEKAFYNLGRTYYKKQEYEKSITAFNDAIIRLPNQPNVYYALALTYNAMKMYGKAADAMTVGLQNDHRFKGDRDKAETEFRIQAETAADDPQDLLDYLEIINY
jgi:Tfp pilus assembly protein PilF